MKKKQNVEEKTCFSHSLDKSIKTTIKNKKIKLLKVNKTKKCSTYCHDKIKS